MKLELERKKKDSEGSSLCGTRKAVIVGLFFVLCMGAVRGTGVTEENEHEMRVKVSEYLERDVCENVQNLDDFDLSICSDGQEPLKLLRFNGRFVDGHVNIIICAYGGSPLDQILSVLDISWKKHLPWSGGCREMVIDILCDGGDMTKLYKAILRFIRNQYNEIESLHVNFENANTDKPVFIRDLKLWFLNNYDPNLDYSTCHNLRKFRVNNADISRTFLGPRPGPITFEWDEDGKLWKITPEDQEGQRRLDRELGRCKERIEVASEGW